MRLSHGSRITPVALLLAIATLAGCNGNEHSPSSTPQEPAMGEAASQPAAEDNTVVPVPGGLQATDRSTIQCNLDLVSGQPASTPVTLSRANPAAFEGWAFAAGQPALEAPLLVFSGPSESFQAKINAGNPRPDVASSFGMPEIQNAGFTTMVNVTALPAGEYQLWLATGTQASDKACDLKVQVAIND